MQQAEQGQTIFNGMLIEWDARDAPEWLFSRMCPSWLIKLFLISRARIYLLYPCLSSIFSSEKNRMAVRCHMNCLCLIKVGRRYSFKPRAALSKIQLLNVWVFSQGRDSDGRTERGSLNGLFLFPDLHPFITGMVSYYSVMAGCRNEIVVCLLLSVTSSGRWAFSVLVPCVCTVLCREIL